MKPTREKVDLRTVILSRKLSLPVFPQCPRGTGLSTLPPLMLQGTVVSNKQTSQSLPRNLVVLGGSRPAVRIPEQLNWSVSAGQLLQGIKSVVLTTPETSPEKLVPLVDILAAWRRLPNVF